jgi:hypothetical protein
MRSIKGTAFFLHEKSIAAIIAMPRKFNSMFSSAMFGGRYLYPTNQPGEESRPAS